MKSVITFEFNYDKALQVINYLDEKYKSNGKCLDKLSLFKLLFQADIYHLNKYGRLILGGNWVAMDNGQVHSELYSMLNTDTHTISIVGHHVSTKVDKDYDELSKSDIGALDWVIAKFGNQSSSQLVNLAHQNSLWQKYHKPGTSTRIPTEEMVESVDMKEYLQFWSEENEKFENWLTNA